MAKGKTGTKKPTPTARAAARRAPSAKPSAAKSAKPKPRAPVRTPSAKPSAKPAPKPTAKAAPKPAAKAAPRATAKPSAPAKPLRAPAPVAPPKPVKKVEAPKPFQREYRRWLERLLALRRQLVIDGERLGEEGLKAQEQEVSVDHMADFGSDSYEQDTTLSLIENKSDALRDVDEAIKRIELKTYGLCEECEQVVPHGRLEVLPHARYCVKCQAARESLL